MATLYLAQQTKLHWETWRAPVFENRIYASLPITIYQVIKFVQLSLQPIKL